MALSSGVLSGVGWPLGPRRRLVRDVPGRGGVPGSPVPRRRVPPRGAVPGCPAVVRPGRAVIAWFVFPRAAVPGSRWSGPLWARAAGAGVVGAGVVGAGVVVGGRVGARRDVRQGVEEEPEVGVGAQQVDAAAGAGGLHGAGQGGEAGHRGGGVHGGQVHAGQGGGVMLGRVQADPGPPLGRLPAFLGTLGVGQDHGAGDGGAELAVGLPACGGQHLVLDGAGEVVGKDGGGLGDDPGPGQVDVPGQQRGTGGGQPPAQGHGQVSPPRRRAG